MSIGWLIYSKADAMENRAFIEWFMIETKKQNITLQLILREELTIGILRNQFAILYKGRKVDLPIFAIVRTVEPLLNLRLEQLGVYVFNSSYIADICNHKSKTYFEIARLGIPMKDTIFINSNNFTSEPPSTYPFVLKEATGRGGKQVYFIENESDWDKYLTNVAPGDYVVQSSDVKLGKDLRVFVVGKEIVGAVLRESNTDFRANYKLGGTASFYQLNADEECLIRKIIHHFEFGMVGIDFLIGQHNELYFNEIEDVVGSRTLSAVSDINIVEKYVTYIKAKINQDSLHE